jgi:steroid delta-isomerase-like uncharacterized protein
MKKSETNLKVVQRLYDAYNNKDESILDEVIADDFVDYGHEPPGRGVQGAKKDYRGIVGGFSDIRWDIEEMIAADDRIVARWTAHATHTGPFLGVPPTQRKIVYRGMSLYRLRDGKITETRNLADFLAILTQLGAIEKKANVAA